LQFLQKTSRSPQATMRKKLQKIFPVAEAKKTERA
jgi:hypothetical protein